MVRLEGRQWGLVALVAGTPFVVAFLLAAGSPGIVAPVLGTALGGASWLLAALLGLLGGVVFAGCLSGLAQSPGFRTSPLWRAFGLIGATLVPMGLCIVPALCLLLAGPALALRLERGEVVLPHAAQERLDSPRQLAQRLRERLPQVIPSLPQVNPW